MADDSDFSTCRFVLESDAYGQPIRHCARMISRRAQEQEGGRLNLNGPARLHWCQEHLARLPYWP